MEELITHPTALLAYDKKYYGQCKYSFAEDGLPISSDYPGAVYSRPTQSVLARWLREKHGIHVEPGLMFMSPYNYGYKIKRNAISMIGSGISNKFETYEEAYEKGLLSALKLI